MGWKYTLLVFFVSFRLGADFDAGLKAYNAGDYAEALKQWQPLADQGAPHAQYNLGLMYARGQGVPQDFVKAAGYYTKAAEQGIVEAEYNLGVLYSNGQGVPKDQTEAGKWFLKAASQGDVNAATSLGNIYDEGQGFQNFTEAAKWYRKAAESGVASAQFDLGVMYDIGQGVKQDFAEALKWYEKAAAQGNAGALCNLAILYYNGQGVPLDRVQAHRYFLIARDLGEPRASNLIKLTAEKLNKKQLAEALEQANAWRRDHPTKAPEGLKPPEETIVATADMKPERQTPVAERLAMGSVSTAVAPPPEPEKHAIWTGVERVVAAGDIHGDYDQFVATLRSAQLIDESNNWIGGKTHLVQTGDILDRGGRSRDVMDLLMNLQRQARAAGGYVHCLLGNHEVMNLYGDLRYVSPGEFAAFVTPDSAGLRDREFQNFRQAAGPKFNVSIEEWDLQHPLGFFEQRAAFGPDGGYGKWLRSLDTAIRIDDTIYTHAGISRKYASMSIDEINRRVREELADPARLQGGIVTDQEGPFWYAGLAKGDEKALATVVDTTLENNGAKREVIGHDYGAGSSIPRFSGKVIPLDKRCLLVEGGKTWVLHRGQKLELSKDEAADRNTNPGTP